ncbi:MAG: alanine racemase [Cyanobacteria bacterium P01_H01_bin.15]
MIAPVSSVPSPLPGLAQLRAWVEIDLDALRQNVQNLKELLAPTTELMAVVKADAYGHGVVPVARTALSAGATWLAIATLTEGIELRKAGITAPILVLGLLNTKAEIQLAQQWSLQPTLGNLAQASMAALAIKTGTLPVHLKLDTGMSRLGAHWTEVKSFVQTVQAYPQLKIASLYSHFATADEPDEDFFQLQQQRFQQTIAELQAHQIPIPSLHLANSAGTLRQANTHYDWVRIGLSLYGLYPADFLRSQMALQPVMAVRARITQIKQIEPGTGVSYGHRFISDQPMRIAVVGIGYADGVPRRLSNQLEVLVSGQKVRQLGSITMDQLMIDISRLPHLEPGTVVTLLGRNGNQSITADDWAQSLGTISWEILCGFRNRLPRIYSDSQRIH